MITRKQIEELRASDPGFLIMSDEEIRRHVQEQSPKLKTPRSSSKEKSAKQNTNKVKIGKSFVVDKDGFVYFSVTSNGFTGLEWIDYFRKRRIDLDDDAKYLLKSRIFKPTRGITTRIVVIPGTFFEDADRKTLNIRREARKRNLEKPNPEVACLIAQTFSVRQWNRMRFGSIVVMHNHLKNPITGYLDLLSVGYADESEVFVPTHILDNEWLEDCGFAFAMPSPDIE